MILTDEMLMAAFRFREAEMWKHLGDYDLFAFRLSDGETGYCCVMGYAGEHFALGFYRGAKGFSSYLRSIELYDLSQSEMMEMALTFDCINCDFMNSTNAQWLNKETKARIREFAKTNGFKIRRPNGWPDFTSHVPYETPSCINKEQDAKDITEALKVAVAVAEQLKSESWKNLSAYGFDPKHQYPSKSGGKSVPFLIPKEDGTYEWSTTELPAFVEEKFPVPEYDNMIMSARLKAMQQRCTLQCRVIHIPTSTLLCVDQDTEFVFPIISRIPVEEDPIQIINAFASVLLNAEICPSTIAVSDNKTQALLTNFCKKCGIKLHKVKKMPELESAWNYMMMYMM